MSIRGLQTRFLLAGAVLVLVTIACGAWSALTFAQLAAAAGQTMQRGQEALELATTLAGALEREDDALLLALDGHGERAREELYGQRRRFDDAYAQRFALARDAEEKATVAALGRAVASYRDMGDDWLRGVRLPGALRRYRDEVNPALRRALVEVDRVRAVSFQAMRQVALRARDVAGHSFDVIAVIGVGALVASALLATRLTRGIVQPVRDLTESVEAIRRGDFQRRVRVGGSDELGRLSEGFNRMAETLDAYRASNLGELLRVQTTLQATLASLPAAVIVVDPDGEIVSANPRARGLLEARGRLEVRRLDDLPLPADDLQAVRRALAGERITNTHGDLRRALPLVLEGRPVHLLPAAAPIDDFLPGRCGAVLVFNDVTEFVRLEELRGELVAVASHELKTPLTTLRLTLLLLEERAENLTPRQREILGAAVLGSEELGGTIDELLDLTRIEAGQFRLVRDAVDMRAVIDQTMRSLRLRYEDAGVTLTLEARVANISMRGDPARLRIVVANLLTNALKYTPRGGTVVIDMDARAEDALILCVTDSGPGIPAEFRDRVFEKFFRIEHQRAWGSDGTRGAGIGLYLCRQIVEAHGGTIVCTTGDEGRGTRFVIEMPFVYVSRPPRSRET